MTDTDRQQEEFAENLFKRSSGIARVFKLDFAACRIIPGSSAQKRAQELILEAIAQPDSLNCDLYRKKAQQFGVTDISPSAALWMEKAEKEYSCRKLMIEQEMAQCQASAIREQLRRCYIDAAALSIARGDISTGKQSLQQCKEYCGSIKQSVDVSLAYLELALISSEWNVAASILNRNELLVISKDDSGSIESSKVRAAHGLHALSQSANLYSAARHFLSVSASLGDSFNTVVHVEEISTYAILCALASFSRDELKQLVLGNIRAKALLELQPGLCEAVQNTVNGRYAEAREAVERIRCDLVLDESIAPYVDVIYRGIQMRSMVSYITPYIVADLRIMAGTFKRSLQEIVKDVAELISKQTVSGRIDAQELTYTKHAADPRKAAVSRILHDGRTFLVESRSLVLRSALLKADVVARFDVAREREREAPPSHFRDRVDVHEIMAARVD